MKGNIQTHNKGNGLCGIFQKHTFDVIQPLCPTVYERCVLSCRGDTETQEVPEFCLLGKSLRVGTVQLLPCSPPFQQMCRRELLGRVTSFLAVFIGASLTGWGPLPGENDRWCVAFRGKPPIIIWPLVQGRHVLENRQPHHDGLHKQAGRSPGHIPFEYNVQ